MKNYKPYPKYKDSGIPWLGEIPEHWEVAKLKYLIKIQKGKVPKEFSNKENSLPYLSMEYLRGKLAIPSYVLPQENLIEVEKDELLILWDGANAGEVMKSKKGVLSSTMAVIRINENYFDKRFFFHFLKWLEKELKIFANGTTIPHLDSSVLIDNHYSIPNIEEQTAIARFLDYKLAKINRFTQKKKQLIKLLNEQKAAIINQAVTKGLDPNAKMKDSGIEWLGEIPEHWEVWKLKYVANFQSGEMITSETIADSGEYPVYGGGGFRGYTNDYTNEGHHVLIGRQGALCGNIKYADGKFWASEHAIVTYPKVEIETFLLGEILRVANLGNLSQTAAQPGISIGQIKNVKVPTPTLSEQQQIVSYIEKETAIINTTISKIEKELALTEEYKTALIAEAVTGKIDVRGYEVPEITEEETYEEIEEEISMATEDAEEYETIEE
jgi:type I restriction enzyme, S subunit